MDIGQYIYMAVSQSTVSRCIHEIIDIMSRQEIMDQWIKFPRILPELNDLRTQYKSGFILVEHKTKHKILCCVILQMSQIYYNVNINCSVLLF